jgi:glutamate/tyrosine decarboxylase-like PLP-dependent enzyme
MPETAGGCFVSGGSAGNLSALVVAREVAKRKAGPAGSGRRWRVAVSEDAHSSITNTLRILEMDPLVVRSEDHRLTGAGLRAAIEADGEPGSLAAVVATSGTTNAGIIDDLSGAAEIARQHQLWFHVDGAYGGPPCSTSVRDNIAASACVRSSWTRSWLFAPFDCAALAGPPWPGPCTAGRLLPGRRHDRPGE